MGSQNGVDAALSADWLGRAATGGATRHALTGYPGYTERARETGRGEGGDMTLVIDRAPRRTRSSARSRPWAPASPP